MRLVSLAMCTLLMLGSAFAAGDPVYRWKGADGKVHYGDTPPAGAQDVRNFDNRFARPSGSPAPVPAAATDEEVAARDAACATKRGQLKAYRNATQLIERDALGRDREYSPEERKQLIAKVEAEVETQCEGAQPE